MKRPGKMVREVLRAATRKPVTVRYPFVRPHIPQKFRGKLAFTAATCIGCHICERDCPAAAIVIRKIADKKFEADIDLARCIYCGQCADSCPKKSLAMTTDFELAQLTRGALKIVIKGDPNAVLAAPAAPAAKAVAAASVAEAAKAAAPAAAAPSAPGNPPEKKS
jgi:formate hydrogenlyase subunit 6/NADH:ubiquinone oxidoreductase subunit I